MNWLAHVFLSPDNVNFKIGNLLTDVSRPEHLQIDDADFQAGVQCHYEIDRFTDSHPLVKESKKVFFPKYRHFSAVLVDLFYDHFLAVEWSHYSDKAYRAYIDDFYKELRSSQLLLHSDSESFVESIYKHDRLGIYDKLEGVDKALNRISSRIRLRTKIDIRTSKYALKENYNLVQGHFREFFPELQKHIEGLHESCL